MRAPAPGFLALYLDGERPELVAGRRGRASADPRLVERAVRHADAGADAGSPVPPALVRRIVRAIRRHARARAAARLVGPEGDTVAPPSSPLRRAVLARAGALVAAAPPHARARVAADVAALRGAAERPWGAGVERAVAELAGLPDGEWLPAVLGALRARASGSGGPRPAGPFRVVTILVLQP